MSDLRWGMGWGTAVSLLLSLYVLGLYLFGGATPFEREGEVV